MIRKGQGVRIKLTGERGVVHSSYATTRRAAVWIRGATRMVPWAELQVISQGRRPVRPPASDPSPAAHGALRRGIEEAKKFQATIGGRS